MAEKQGMKAIGVGVIGASPLNPGWAVAAHLPAIREVEGLELRAIGTSSARSAAAARQAYGVPAFADVDQLLAQPGLDLVVVAVKVPYHRALIEAALRARKMVFSEWPLAGNLHDAQQLAELADQAGVRSFIGLQARHAPALRQARDLIKQGYIGELLGTSLTGSGMAWGPHSDSAHAYMFDAGSGASVLSVPVLHALDAMAFVLGEIETVNAVTAVRRGSVQLIDSGERHAVTAPDHVALSATLYGGAPLSVYYRGGATRAGNLRWEINGTQGDLVLSADNGNIQVADLRLEGGSGADAVVSELPVAFGGLHDGKSGIGANVLREYAALAGELSAGTRAMPDFGFALRRHRLLAAIEEAARSGLRQRLG